MTKEELEKTKELFYSGFCNIEWLKRNKTEWNQFNIPIEYLFSWSKEFVKKSLYSIKMENNEINNNFISNQSHCLDFSITLKIINNYKLYDFFDKIVELYKIFNHSKYLLFSETVGDDRDKAHLTKYLISDSELNYDKEKKYFDTGERFFGILPLLKQLNKVDLYNDILDVLFDFIENAGYFNKRTVEATYNYINSLGDKNLIDRLIKCIKKLKINYQSLYPMWDLNEHKELHLDKEFEINSLKNIYYLLILDESEPNNYDRNIEIRRNYIDNCINYFGLSKDIFSSCKDEVLPFIKDKLEHIDEFLNFDTSFVSLEKHSIYYKELLNDYAFFYEYSRTATLKEMLTRFWNYYIAYSELNGENLEIITRCLKYFYENKIFIYQIFRFSDRLITKDGKSGLLIKYFNEGNDELFSLYKRFSLDYIDCNHGDAIDVAKGLKILAKELNDQNLEEYCDENIKRFERVIEKNPGWYHK